MRTRTSKKYRRLDASIDICTESWPACDLVESDWDPAKVGAVFK